MWSKLLLFLFSIIIAIALFNPISHFKAIALDNFQVSSKNVYYTIYGNTAPELRREINQKGPYSQKHQKRFTGFTRWYVRWRYNYETNSNDTCQLVNPRIQVTSTITLPQWNPESNTSDTLIQDWNRFLKALIIHENGHKTHGESAAREIRELLNSYPISNLSCAELGEEANAKSKQIIKKYNQKDIDYDQRTQHGRTQGAYFPS